MVITFIVHRTIVNENALSERVIEVIYDNTSPRDTTTFYCGGYGDFDRISVKA